MSVMVGLNMCDWISCSSSVVLHVPSPYDHCALARKGGPGGLTPWAGGLAGPSAPPGQQGGLGGGTPPNDRSDSDLLSGSGVPQLNSGTDLLPGNLLSVESTFGDGVVNVKQKIICKST